LKHGGTQVAGSEEMKDTKCWVFQLHGTPITLMQLYFATQKQDDGIASTWHIHAMACRVSTRGGTGIYKIEEGSVSFLMSANL
jgi:hypothetical protein